MTDTSLSFTVSYKWCLACKLSVVQLVQAESVVKECTEGTQYKDFVQTVLPTRNNTGMLFANTCWKGKSENVHEFTFPHFRSKLVYFVSNSCVCLT